MTAAAFLAALVLLGGSPRLDPSDTPSAARLAQFGEMTKKRATPVPQRTAAPSTQRNVERRGAPPQPGGAFGGMRK